MVQVVDLTVVKNRDTEVVEFAQVVKLHILYIGFIPTGDQLSANFYSPYAIVHFG